MPPITVRNLPTGNFFEQNRKIQSFLAQPIKISYSTEGVKYYTSSRQDYDKLYNILKMEKVEFFSHEPRETKQIQIVVKRLPSTVDPATLKEELENLNFTISHVRQMTAPTQNPDGTISRRPIPIWVVTLPNNDNSQRIFNIKDINQHIVHIEAYKATPHVIQCHRCQQFGHTAKRCNMEIHCVKCGNNHIFADCPTKGPSHQPKCSNCLGQHTASYSQCPAQQAQRKALQQKLKERQGNTSTRNTNFQQQEAAFPALQQPRQNDLNNFISLFSSPPTTQPSPPTESLTDSLKDIIALVKNLNIPKILHTIHTTLIKFAAAKDPITKIITLFEIATSFTSPSNGP